MRTFRSLDVSPSRFNRFKNTESKDTMNQKLGDINDQTGKMVALKCSVNDVEILKEVFRFTPLASKVKNPFQCMVCLDLIKPLVTFATCCKKSIACKDCMEHWIPDTCPHRRGITGDNIELNQLDNMFSFFSEK